MVVEGGLLEAVVVLEQLDAVSAASPEDQLVEADADFLRDFKLQVKHADSSIYDQVVLVYVVLSILYLLRRDSCVGYVTCLRLAVLRGGVVFDLVAQTVQLVLDLPLRSICSVCVVDDLLSFVGTHRETLRVRSLFILDEEIHPFVDAKLA